MTQIKFSEVKVGDKLIADGGFDCLKHGLVCTVCADDEKQENLYVPCDRGSHFLDGQVTAGCLVGFTRAKKAA